MSLPLWFIPTCIPKHSPFILCLSQVHVLSRWPCRFLSVIVKLLERKIWGQAFWDSTILGQLYWVKNERTFEICVGKASCGMGAYNFRYYWVYALCLDHDKMFLMWKVQHILRITWEHAMACQQTLAVPFLQALGKHV